MGNNFVLDINSSGKHVSNNTNYKNINNNKNSSNDELYWHTRMKRKKHACRIIKNFDGR